MSKAEEFIQENIKRCSECIRPFEEWLTPDQTRKAVEIAREEMIEKACNYLREHREEVKTEDNGIAGWISDEFIENFRKNMEE